MRQTAGPPEPLTVDEDSDAGDPTDALVAADALPKDAAAALRRLMRERGLSQIDLHKRLGVTEATVSRWLSRRQGMPLSTLQRICDALAVPLSAILVPGAPAEGDPVGLVRQAVRTELEALQGGPRTWLDWLQDASVWRDEQDQRLQRIEAAQTELHTTQERMRRALRRVPLYQQNHRGDPRLGEGDPNAALVVSYAQLPPGATERTLGLRGFAVLVNNAVVAGLGVRRGDVVFVNPDAPYTAGSLVALGSEWPEGPEGAAPPGGQPRALTLRVLAYGAAAHHGALIARTALEPPLAQAPDLAPGAFVVYGPVVLHQGNTFLPEGRGHPRVLRRERPQHPPADGGEPPEPGTPLAPPVGAAGPDDRRKWTIGPDGRPISFLDDAPPPPLADPLGEPDGGAAHPRP